MNVKIDDINETSVTANGVTFHFDVGLLSYGNTIIDLKRVVAITEENDYNITFLFDGAERLTVYMPFDLVFGMWRKFKQLQAIK